MEKFFHKKKGGEAHDGREWDSNESSSDSSNEDITTVTINKRIFFPNVDHKCLMAKEETLPNILLLMMRVMMMMTNLYFLKALAITKLRKKYELVKSINEKDELLKR